MRFFDYCALIITVLSVILFSLLVYGNSEGESIVFIEADKDTFVYSLSVSQVIEIEGPIGVTIIRIDRNSVRVEDSPCMDKLCIRMGVLTRNGEWSACLPNRIFVRIEAREHDEIDALSF